jgi:hypothetical protein
LERGSDDPRHVRVTQNGQPNASALHRHAAGNETPPPPPESGVEEGNLLIPWKRS